MWKTISYIAAGSALGGVFRYLMQQFIYKRLPSSFPYGTLCVNLVACFAIGTLIGLFDRGTMSLQMRLFLTVGLCGGFSTFSAFMHENYSLLQSGQLVNALLYTGFSLFAGLAATAIGLTLTKTW